MKATGIVRRIDELGRVVIPKEIRRTLKIKEGDPLEIFTQRDGELIFKKYSPINAIADFADGYAEALSEATGGIAIITDTDQVIAMSGASKKDFMDRDISNELAALIEARGNLVAKLDSNQTIPVINENPEEYAYQIIYPIISNGDSLGSVILVSKKTSDVITEAEEKIVKTATLFIAKQLEE